ncbi:MAG: asparagine synthase (glutamine-hydrolyzing) [Candidatus Hodarchaeales archaeon]|jgi:asparagine synthase (glutamine-hydrolysing)
MCGILAIIGPQNYPPSKEFQDSLNKMKHRGPDAVQSEKIIFKSSSNFNITLGHHRLAIIDLSENAIQPMHTEDDKFTIIYNGEIYNYIELREELIKHGETFFSDSDTEVLLKGYKVFGKDILSKLNGMFAFIIINKEKEEIFIVRDRFGIKPLYYSYYKDFILFSSEMKPIIQLRNGKITPNEKVIWDYLNEGSVDRSDETFYTEIQRFHAGYYGIVTADQKLRFKEYWNIEKEVNQIRKDETFKKKTYNEHVKTIQDLFISAVRLRLRSDVSVGSNLSGGIDSSSIVSVVNQIISQEQRKNFETFSMVFDESFSFSEHKFIDIITQNTGFTNHRQTPTVSDINDKFNKFMWHQEEPVSGLSPFGGFSVMELASEKGAIVLLNGQGADEILAGYFPLFAYYFYELFKEFHWKTLLREIRANRYKRSVKSFLAQLLPLFLHEKLILRERGVRKYLNQEFVRKNPKRRLSSLWLRKTPLNQALMKNLTNNFQHMLRYDERNSMAFSIEVRVPFLDVDLVSYILALPSKYIINKGTTKWIFRDAMKGLTPESILSRNDKIGFAVPEILWLQEDKPIFFKNLQEEKHPLLKKYVEIRKIDKLLENRKELSNVDLMFLFRVACLNSWLLLFFGSKNH